MPGQATVTIKSKQWSVSVANTITELTGGLSGVESLPLQTGILFDLGYDQKYIAINMSQMLFPLDIIFINSTQGVVGVLENVLPGQSSSLDNDTYPGARCFIEVNAGEAEGVEIGDSVVIEGYVQASQFDFSSLMNVVVIMVLMLAMSKVLSAPKPKHSLASGAKTKAPPQIAKRTEDLQEKKLTLENTGRDMASKAGVEFLRLDDGWQPRYATVRYWFKGSEGNEIVARDLEELKWKLSLHSAKGEQMKTKVIPNKQTGKKDIEYLADSPEFLTQTIEDIGYRQKIDSAFEKAIERAKGLK